jgi:hypothetical protein
MKILFIHGFVENRTIFDELRKYLTEGEQIALNLEEEFAAWKNVPTEMNVVKLASHLIGKYNINSEDVVIGHSMGGWIATHIKQITACKAILLASFTNQSKITLPINNLWTLKFLVNSGLLQSNLAIDYFKKAYPFAETKPLHDSLLDFLAICDKTYLMQQLEVLFGKVDSLTVEPDLRIHAKKDNIVRYPDEAYHEVSGDHFSLIFHTQEVISVISKQLSVNT